MTSGRTFPVHGSVMGQSMVSADDGGGASLCCQLLKEAGPHRCTMWASVAVMPVRAPV